MSKKLNGKAKQAARKKTKAIHAIEERIKAKHALDWNNPTDLMSFYWGYKANKDIQGFEFSSMTCEAFGMSKKDTISLGARTKKVVDHQLEVLKTNTTMEVYGLSREDFIAEEHHRMLGTTQNLNILTSKPFKFTDILQDLIIWVCAVSTCVAAGLLEQDNWNGDKFSYVTDCTDANTRKILFGEEVA